MPQRTRVNFWLLLAANCSFYLAVLASGRLLEQGDYRELVFYATVSGQLSTVCIWFVFSSRPAAFRWIVVGLAVVAAALATSAIELTLVDSLGLTAGHTAAMLLALWLYKLALTLRSQRAEAAAQFSLKDLFVLTTASALLAALLSATRVIREVPLFIAFFVLTNVTVAMACLVFWSRAWHFLLRLAAALAVAFAGGWLLTYLRPHLAGELEVMMCLQALIIFTWLEFGEILPKYRRMPHADAAAPNLDTAP
jgi:hypothetical protein